MKEKSIIPIGSRDRVINKRIIKVTKNEEGESKIVISQRANNRSERRKKRKA